MQSGKPIATGLAFLLRESVTNTFSLQKPDGTPV